MSTLEVARPGPLALVEDLGRPGWSAVGVGRSGAADRGALRLANRLLANDEGAAAVEVTLGGLEVVARGDVWVAVTGAPAPVEIGGRGADPYAAVCVRDGERLRLGVPAAGLRTYVAVRGGLDVAPVLGSRSRDVLAEIGPAPLAAGDLLPVGPPPAAYPHVDAVPVPSYEGHVVLRVVRGPRDAWIRAVDPLTTAPWTVSAHSDRVGMRLEGPALALVDPDRQLPSEGAYRGAIQVPPGGQPVVFLADHPVTGGYPVVGVVVDADVDRAAQLRPGEPVRFRWA